MFETALLVIDLQRDYFPGGKFELPEEIWPPFAKPAADVERSQSTLEQETKIARREIVNNQECWVHRKGATRAYPANHFALKDTPFYETGHPILLPGNPTAGSCVMVADPGADKSCYSVNHGAGRAKGRKAAIRELDQKTVDDEFVAHDILTNCRTYPKDEAPAAYKDFNEVLNSVRLAGLASEVARLCETIRAGVRTCFAIELTPEPNFWGF